MRISCAQRLSASKIPSLPVTVLHVLKQKVLNAFRHRRYLHRFWAMMLTGDFACSTPFGIEDTFTHFLHWAWCGGLSAQRLSASKIPSRIWPYVNFIVDRKCSTPFGIEDTFTPLRLNTSRGPDVLNAFRHRRYLHEGMRTFSHVKELSAQRLSASKIPSLISRAKRS